VVNVPSKISKNTVDKNVILLVKFTINGKYLCTCVEKPAVKRGAGTGRANPDRADI